MKDSLGIVAAPHHLAASIGTSILKAGGNAFDAAVSVALAIGVSQPYHSGLGGGCNITYLTSSGEKAHINARGPASKNLHRDIFLKDDVVDYDLVQTGGLAVTIPSFVAGLSELHEGRGKLTWEQVCSVVIPLASEGFSADFALEAVYNNAPTREKLVRYAEKSIFAKPVVAGQYIRQEQLAKTLSLIAKNRRAIYEGDLAKQVVDTVQRNGGVLNLDDLANYKPQLRTLNECQYREWRVLAPDLPTVGSLQTQLALSILNQFSVTQLGLGSAKHQHLIAEVVKASYLERAKVASNQEASAMIKEAISKRLAAEISLEGTRVASFEDEPRTESCTSHFCVADNEGNVVSQTQTIRSHFGSGIIDPETGIVLNDSVGDFSLKPGDLTTQGIRYQGTYNLLEPNAEPASSQSPLIALHPNGDIIAAGAAGGPRIVSATLQALLNQIDFNMNPQIAVALPRVHSHGPITNVELEDSVAAALRDLGHSTEIAASAGIAQSICRRDGQWQGGADPRGPGAVSITDGKTVKTYGYHP